jgi:hypothetical protein
MSFSQEAGAWGEGRARGAKAIDFKQDRRGNSPPWTRDRLPGKGIFFLYFSFFKECVQNKKEFSVQGKNKPRVGTRNMRLFLVHLSSW